MLSSADLHVGDLDLCEVLPVPAMAAIAVAAREPEDANFLVLAVPDDFGGDLRALQLRRAGLHALAVAHDEHLVEGDFITRLGVEQWHFDGHTGFGAELLAA